MFLRASFDPASKLKVSLVKILMLTIMSRMISFYECLNSYMSLFFLINKKKVIMNLGCFLFCLTTNATCSAFVLHTPTHKHTVAVRPKILFFPGASFCIPLVYVG